VAAIAALKGASGESPPQQRSLSALKSGKELAADSLATHQNETGSSIAIDRRVAGALAWCGFAKAGATWLDRLEGPAERERRVPGSGSNSR
ncbi:MAG TPA: hypothetical protein VNZ22_02640, partial [Bacillota bacterium]|nr:hypothetical protein [Bacillota bacterium]